MFDNFKKQNINFIEILFTKYKYINPKYRGKYHLPGARMDTDDTPGEGLLREIAEETGLQGVELVLPCSATRWGPVMPGFGIKYSVTYLAQIAGRPVPNLPDDEDHMGAEWVTYTKAVEAEFTFPGVNEAVRQTGVWAKRLGVLRDE